MWKQLSALLRGQHFEAGERLADRHALVVLRQQIRDSADAVAAARKAVALTLVHRDREAETQRKLAAGLADLEDRTVAALEQSKPALAREGAEAIARLEAERDASSEALARFDAEIARLSNSAAEAGFRLRRLQQGQRVAAAASHAQRLRDGTPGAGLSTLRDAEDTLTRLRERQTASDFAADLSREADAAADPARVSAKLAGSGCGAALPTGAAAVLERLAARLTPCISS